MKEQDVHRAVELLRDKNNTKERLRCAKENDFYWQDFGDGYQVHLAVSDESKLKVNKALMDLLEVQLSVIEDELAALGVLKP